MCTVSSFKVDWPKQTLPKTTESRLLREGRKKRERLREREERERKRERERGERGRDIEGEERVCVKECK